MIKLGNNINFTASSKTLDKPSCVNALHSKYFFAPIFCANNFPYINNFNFIKKNKQ